MAELYDLGDKDPLGLIPKVCTPTPVRQNRLNLGVPL